MRIDLDKVRQLGEEYGWAIPQIEQALATAVRLCYADQDMLVEVDVDLGEGEIACRRFTGDGPSATWTDIRNPLMPTIKSFMKVMEMVQWGDGSPGRVLDGTVTGYRDGGVIYRVGANMVFVPENLLAVMDYHTRPPLGTEQVLVLINSREGGERGMRMATRRGKEFVAAVMESFHPESLSGIWMGASNSWAVLRMKQEHMNTWLESGGVNIKYMQQILGIRRITGIPEGRGENALERRNNAGVGRRSADTVFVERLHKAGFRKARRRIGKVLVGLEVVQIEYLIDFDRRQCLIGLVVFNVIRAFLIDRDEPRLNQCRTGCAQAGSSGPVDSLTLEHYPGMTEASISRILDQAEQRWPLLASHVVHRVGEMAPGEQIVLVAVASAHRNAAFAAAEFIMDYLKTDAVFWKREVAEGNALWVQSTGEDAQRAHSWEQKS